MERSDKQFSSRGAFALFFNLIALKMSKALDLSKLLKKLILKRSGTSWKEKGVSRDNQLQNIWD